MFDLPTNDGWPSSPLDGAEQASSAGIARDRSAHPPIIPIIVGGAALAFGLVAFVAGTRAWHLTGYLVCAVGVALCAVVFRVVDRSRRRSSRYVASPARSRAIAVMLVLAIGVAAVHAFYFAQTRTLSA